MLDLRFIILDFDGVLVESVGIKDKAFEVLFEDSREYFREIIDYCHAHNATIRFEKFKHVYKNILKKDFTDITMKQLSERFAKLVVKAIIECPSVEGADDFLQTFYGHVPLYLVSITPPDELDGILGERCIKKYFRGVYAHPWNKKDAIKNVLMKDGFCEHHGIFIGDSPEDYEAVREIGVNFIGRRSNKALDSKSYPVFENLKEIKEYLLLRVRLFTKQI